MVFQLAANRRFVTDQQEFYRVIALPRTRGTGEYDGQPPITAHRINGDSRGAGHVETALSLIPSALDGQDFASVIMAAGRAEVMRTLQLTTVRAFLERLDLEGVVRPAHATPRRRGFSLRNCHFGTF